MAIWKKYVPQQWGCIASSNAEGNGHVQLTRDINNEIGYKYTYTLFGFMYSKLLTGSFELASNSKFYFEKIHPKLIIKLMEPSYFESHTKAFPSDFSLLIQNPSGT